MKATIRTMLAAGLLLTAGLGEAWAQPPGSPGNPLYQGPGRVEGLRFDQWGRVVGVDTGNTSVAPSFYDPTRTNVTPGSAQWVDYYDANGRRVTGWKWQSVTGQDHGQLNIQTNNGLGGVHNEKQFHLTNPSASQPRPAPGRGNPGHADPRLVNPTPRNPGPRR